MFKKHIKILLLFTLLNFFKMKNTKFESKKSFSTSVDDNHNWGSPQGFTKLTKMCFKSAHHSKN